MLSSIQFSWITSIKQIIKVEPEPGQSDGSSSGSGSGSGSSQIPRLWATPVPAPKPWNSVQYVVLLLIGFLEIFKNRSHANVMNRK